MSDAPIYDVSKRLGAFIKDLQKAGVIEGDGVEADNAGIDIVSSILKAAAPSGGTGVITEWAIDVLVAGLNELLDCLQPSRVDVVLDKGAKVRWKLE
jgi:hypothetical protein